MEEAGAELVVHYNDMAFMGFIEILFYFRKILKNLKHCRRDILTYNPDVVILIDFAGFNLKIASFLKKKNIKSYFYISPKVWAWYTGRAKKIKRNVDRMFVILPFEKAFYAKYGFEVDYVGNPVIDAVNQHKPDSSFLEDPRIFNKQKYVALLPGSRKQELKSILPNLVKMASDFSETQFILGGIKSISQGLYSDVENVPNITIVYDRTYDVLAFSHAAVVTSGTATLETALWDIPQVVIYRSNSPVTVLIVKMVIKVKFISLVNLIAGREVVRELIQEKLTREHLNDEMLKLLDDTTYRDRIYNDYAEIRNILGNEPVSDKAADLMIKYLKNK